MGITVSTPLAGLLAYLGVQTDRLDRLAAGKRLRLAEFLIRWEAFDDALACLPETGFGNRTLKQADLRAQALAGLNHHAEAVTLLRRRLTQRYEVIAEIELGHQALAAGNVEMAEEIARRLLESNGPIQVLGLRGAIDLQQNNLDQAEAIFLQYEHRLRAHVEPLLGLTRVYLRRRDIVSAGAYAVRAFGQNDASLPVPTLRALRDLFEQLGDPNHFDDANQRLRTRFSHELKEIRRLTASLIEPQGQDAGEGRPPKARQAKERVTASASEPRAPVSGPEKRALLAAARRLFGFANLLPGQAEVMAAARRGEDVLAVLPTGAGKSLCYQLPAYLDEGTTLVISPLIALMKDQLDSLPTPLRSGAIAINSSLDGRDLSQALDDMAAGRFKLIYTAPERLRQAPMVHALSRAQIAAPGHRRGPLCVHVGT